MKMSCKAVLLGIEQKTSSRGNRYVVGLFQQGINTMRSMIKMECIPQDLKPYQEYELELAYSAYNGQIRLDVTNIKGVLL